MDLTAIKHANRGVNTISTSIYLTSQNIWLVIAGQKYSSQGSCCYTWMIGLVSGGSAETPHKRFMEQQRALNGHNCELTVSLQLWQLCCYSSRVLRASA